MYTEHMDDDDDDDDDDEEEEEEHNISLFPKNFRSPSARVILCVYSSCCSRQLQLQASSDKRQTTEDRRQKTACVHITLHSTVPASLLSACS